MRFHPPRPHLGAAIGLTSAAAILLVAGTAAAYKPTLTCTQSGIYRCQRGETPKQVRWNDRCVTYQVNKAGSDDIPPGEDGRISTALLNAIIGSFATWNEPNGSDLRLIYAGLTSEDQTRYQPGGSNTNVVTWLEDEWPYASNTAYALTSVTFDPTTGLIVDADVELNGAFHTFTNVDEPRATLVDVRNTLTHEAGHFLGLDHSSVSEATMYASAPEGETQKRTLHQDDIEGLVHVYPSQPGDDPSCETSVVRPPDDDDDEDDGLFCASTGSAGPAQSPLPTLLLLGLFVGLARLRRRR